MTPSEKERIARLEALQEQCLTNTEGRFKHIQTSLAKIDTRLETQFVTQAEFKPVRNVLYSMVGVVLGTVLVALVGMVIDRTTSINLPIIP